MGLRSTKLFRMTVELLLQETPEGNPGRQRERRETPSSVRGDHRHPTEIHVSEQCHVSV